ncbi:glycosyltransferase family 2 protein [Quadrisphaera sp. DSM 44207]|uniref:glycosyltransferase family 2 protein n=1 Tax=Quadrisphaera sp. DSM 44207 TaxID=1881057 RepID=UPI00087E45F5|nr:glycosyltransferase family 2 protein [Quadrisphaera sp. DSM 44207]SDQ10602.1 Glycosyl transferase family 2 [Quadrisphaera sp. DSM 44207]
MDDTWLVIPLFEEAAVVGDVVSAAKETFPRVVCVDDGSSDDSAAAAEGAGAVVVRHSINLGQGAALQTGLAYALTDPLMRYAVTFDADGQHRVEDAAAMVARLRAGEADAVFGSRFLDGRTQLSPLKRTVLRAGVAYSNATTGVRMTDAHNGLRALSRDVVASLRLTQNRMAHASELVEQVGRGGWRTVEHPVEILYTDYSRAKGQSVWNSVNILTELLFR